MKKVAIYSRKSKETDTGESIKNQIQMCKDYFIHRNIDCSFEIFQDEGFSGGNTNRPEFQRMLLLAKHGQFDIIACYKVDRIGRNIVDFMDTYGTLQKHNVSLVSVTEGFDPDTAAGRMMMTMIAGFAEMERMNIAQRVKDNMQALAKMGRWSGGTCPTGYRSVKEMNGEKTAMYLELIPEWKDKLQNIFKLVADGQTCNSVGKLFNMPSKTIRNIIDNPVYCKSDERSKKHFETNGFIVIGDVDGKGYLPYNRRPRVNGKKITKSDCMIVAVSKHKAPIDSDIWIKANEQVKYRADEKKPRISTYSWLAHLVKCHCGSGMFVFPGNARKDGSRNYYFRCSSKKCGTKWLNARWAEEDVIDVLMNIDKDNSTLDKYLNTGQHTNYDSEIKSIKKQITNNSNAINKLTDKLILLEGTALQAVTNKMNELSKKNEKLNTTLLKFERAKILESGEQMNKEILIKNISYFLNVFDELSINEKQLYIQSIIKNIIWNGSTLEINLL